MYTNVGENNELPGNKDFLSWSGHRTCRLQLHQGHDEHEWGRLQAKAEGPAARRGEAQVFAKGVSKPQKSWEDQAIKKKQGRGRHGTGRLVEQECKDLE